jgi:hypothetical protein
MRSQENAVSSVSSVSGGVDLSDMLMSPLLACSVCCDRFSRTELAEHMRTTHPSVSSSRHDRDESSSSHLELDDAIPRCEKTKLFLFCFLVPCCLKTKFVWE